MMLPQLTFGKTVGTVNADALNLRANPNTSSSIVGKVYSKQNVQITDLSGGSDSWYKVDYQGKDVLVTLICPIHGEFQQKPHEHLAGNGCQLCGHASIANKLSDRWDPSQSNESDPGVVLLKENALIGDKLSYNMEKMGTRYFT